MKNLLPGLLIISGLVWFSCSQKQAGLQDVTLKSPVGDVVALEGNIDNFVEAGDYEADLYSLSEASLTSYSTGLKSATIGANMFQNMFQNLANFKLRYKDGISPNVTLTTTNGGFPKTLVIDYGIGLTLANGRVLSGTITVNISGPSTTTGSTRTITYANFSNGNTSLSGVSTKTRLKDATNRVFSNSTNLTITLPDLTTMTRVESKTMTWLAGADTELNPADDVIQITGSVQITTRKGDEYSKTITTPLIKTGECKFITKGVVEFKVSTGKFATLDYGNGDCDDQATMTSAKGTKVITLGH